MHRDAVERALHTWQSTAPIESYRQDTELGVEFKVHVRSALPAEVPLIVGDCIHNLRSALDHLVYECVAIPNDRNCQFPTWGDPSTFNPTAWRKTVKRRVPGPHAHALRDALRGLKPYRGGEHEFIWLLTYLDDIDKHRLVLAVSSAVQAVATTSSADVTTSAEDWIAANEGTRGRTFVEVPTGPSGEAMFRDAELKLTLAPDSPYPLVDGCTVLTYAGPGWATIREHGMDFDVVLAEPDHVAGTPLLAVLDVLVSNTETLIMELTGALGGRAQNRLTSRAVPSEQRCDRPFRPRG